MRGGDTYRVDQIGAATDRPPPGECMASLTATSPGAVPVERAGPRASDQREMMKSKTYTASMVTSFSQGFERCYRLFRHCKMVKDP